MARQPAQRSSGAGAPAAPGVWLGPARPGSLPFGLAVFFSLWLHAGLLLALVWAAPRGAGVSLAAPAIGRVALVSLPPPPEPAPPAAPEADRVVLPETPTAPPGRAQPQPDPEPEPEPREPESYEDVLNRLRAEAGEPAPAAASAAPRAAPPGRLASPEVLLWSRRAKVHVTRSWVLGPDMQGRVLEAEVAVLLGPQGQVMSISLRRSSGDAWFDASVERAIGKASPLPPPPEAGVWVFRFRPKDVL